ncbi:hypothetical protein B0J11DRAFT_147108 [Dendryphion nanum]|uniref:Uncharacterized protein n=1 Tax=Dendryphion nanum TaxID=256645 RepID=A0A9P9D6C8_9PLEO|nr:hypothetical protein B0J11DRAFT_147108 [Dendryphion nanum]
MLSRRQRMTGARRLFYHWIKAGFGHACGSTWALYFTNLRNISLLHFSSLPNKAAYPAPVLPFFVFFSLVSEHEHEHEHILPLWKDGEGWDCFLYTCIWWVLGTKVIPRLLFYLFSLFSLFLVSSE